MIKKGIILSMIAAISVLCLFSACGKDGAKGKKIVIATDATWPPMEYIDANKNIVGFDIDMLNAAAKEAGFEIEFKNQAWDGIFAGLAAGKYDAVVSSVTITEERKGTMDFSVPYVNAGQILVVKKELTGMETLDQFQGKKVGAQIGTTGAIEIKKNKKITVKEYDELGLAMEDLAKGRIDAIVCDSPIAADFALQNPKYKTILKIVGVPFTTEEYGVAVTKGNKETLELINKGLNMVKEKGIDKELEKKWLR